MSLGVANTESGHCEKTMSIIHHLGGWASKQSNPPSWYVIADDDTIIGYCTNRIISWCILNTSVRIENVYVCVNYSV